MALLKFKGNESREVPGCGIFNPGDIKTVDDAIAVNMVTGNSDFWEIVTPVREQERRFKKYSQDHKLDTKKKED